MRGYNRYADRYTAPIEGVNYVYQPVFNPQDHAIALEALNKSQQRYDAGQQAVSDFASQVGGMETYSPNVINEQLGKFTSDIDNVVKTQYGGDYGLAANDIVRKIAKEKSNPLYKLNAMQVRAGEEMRQAKLKDPDKFYTHHDYKDVMGEDYLRQAVANKQYDAFDTPRYGYTPDTYALAEKQLQNVQANEYQSVLNELSPAEKAKFSNENGDVDLGLLFKSKDFTGVTAERLLSMKQSMAESMLNQDPYFMKKHGNREAALAEAMDVIESAYPQFVWSRTKQGMDDLSGLRRTPPGDDTGVGNGTILTLPTGNTANNAANQTKVKEEYGTVDFTQDWQPSVANGNVDLDKPFESQIISDDSGIKTPMSVAIIAQKNANNKKAYDEGLKMISGFESRYFPIELNKEEVASGMPNRIKANTIAEYEDAYLTKRNEFVTFANFANAKQVQDEAQYQVNNGNFTGLKVGGKNAPKEGTKYNIDGRYRNISPADIKINGIDHLTGEFIGEVSSDIGRGGGQEARFYPSTQAQENGLAIKALNNDVAQYGFGISQLPEIGATFISAKDFNKNAKYAGTSRGGGFEDLILPIPQQFAARAYSASKSKNTDEGLALFRDIADFWESNSQYGITPTTNQAFFANYAVSGAKRYGYIEKAIKDVK